jgi:parallel beta-helix repeat protein
VGDSVAKECEIRPRNVCIVNVQIRSSLPPVPRALQFFLARYPGFGLTVQGNGGFRIFTLVNSAVVNINNLTITGGGVSGGLGGGIYMGDSGTLFLTNCVVSNNTATNGGGGIWVNDSGTSEMVKAFITSIEYRQRFGQ